MVSPRNWLDEKFPYIRSEGSVSMEPIEGIVDRYRDDPVLGIAGGHPFVDVGFPMLLSALLQAMMPPRNADEAVARLFSPPSPGHLRDVLEAYREALWLYGKKALFYQVDPRADGAEAENQALDISALLPDAPTPAAAQNGQDFFAKRGQVRSISAALVPAVLHAHMNLFPDGGGGYYGLPHGGASIKFRLVGRTLWETVQANVQPRNAAEMARGPWVGKHHGAPCDGTVFAWLRDDIPTLALDRINEKKRKSLQAKGQPVPESSLLLRTSALHPAAPGLAMPRRYRLAAPDEDVCSLSGVHGATFSRFERWPQGPQYAPEGWRHPHVAVATKHSRQDHGWKLEETWSVKAQGPLRVDDWLGVALCDFPEFPRDGKAKTYRAVMPPEVVRSFIGLTNGISEHLYEEGSPIGEAATEASPDLPFSVSAIALFPYGNVAGGMSERSLPVYALPNGLAAQLAAESAGLVEEIAEIAETLRACAAKAAKLGNPDRKVVSPGLLKDALMGRMEGSILRAVRNAARVFSGTDRDAAVKFVEDSARRVAAEARRAALDIFDSAFPVTGSSEMDLKILRARAELKIRLYPKNRPESADRERERTTA